MKLHYMGKYNMDPESLPHGEHMSGAVPFREPKDTKTLSLIATGISLVLAIFFGAPVFMRGIDYWGSPQVTLGCFASLLVFLPHEFLHAICFRSDVYLYTNLKQGMLFVTGPETMSKRRFIFMSLLPNIVFGFIPYVLWIIFPDLVSLAIFGALNISSGAGDYINVFNGLTQMPRGSCTYIYGMHSYWYMPEKK